MGLFAQPLLPSPHFCGKFAGPFFKLFIVPDSQFYRILPDPALQKVIDSYWIIRQPAVPEAVLPMVPMGYPFLEFSLNDNAMIQYQGEGTSRHHHFVIGLYTRPLYFRNSGSIHSVLVRLQPWGLAVLSAGAAQMNMPLEVTSTLRGQWDSLIDILRRCKTANIHKTTLDRFFRDYLFRAAVEVDERVVFALRKILQHQGNLSVSTLEQQLFLSQRRLEQLFKQHLGLSPKSYADIARFQSVLSTAGGQVNLTELALESGYYDQSHFIRHFKKFTGVLPSAFLDLEAGASEKISNLYNFARS